MLIRTINASDLKRCFLAGANALDADKERINELNVFPVPDGDTGSNMTMTIMSAAKAVNQAPDDDMNAICKAISSGSLRGARGNSGVILSQLLRGFTKAIKDKEEIDVPTLVDAYEKAVDSAYKAVMKPKEGTILTVARSGAEKAIEILNQTDNILEFVNTTIQHMHDTLDETPEILPVLKKAGVVDSGGAGLLTVLEGAYDALLGKEVKTSLGEDSTKVASADIRRGADMDVVADAEIKYGYCTEFIILLEKEFTYEDEKEFKAYLESIGDSIVCVTDDEIVKIHVHTNDPGLAIQKALTFGQLSRMKIDNMREEHNERVIKNSEALAAKQKIESENYVNNGETASIVDDENIYSEDDNEEKIDFIADPTKGSPIKSSNEKKEIPHKENAYISVSVGDGLDEIFKDLGADALIQGGQTMNPSTEDILGAIESVNADNIFILPNNSNIILAAEQTKSIVEDKNIFVVPTKSIPQGIAAMLGIVEGVNAKDNLEEMLNAANSIKDGEVTYAVRDTSIDGFDIKAGDIMGIGEKKIRAVEKNVIDATISLVKELASEDSEIITLYVGQESDEKEAEEISARLSEEGISAEVDIQYGGQPVYYYLVSVE